MSPLISQIANFATPPLVAVLTAVITVRPSFRRFQDERWWDRKADAYSRIIESLHHIVALNSLDYSEFFGEATGDEEHREKIRESYSKAISDLELATGVGAYAISDDAAKVLADLSARPKHDNPFIGLEADLRDYPEALVDPSNCFLLYCFPAIPVGMFEGRCVIEPERAIAPQKGFSKE